MHTLHRVQDQIKMRAVMKMGVSDEECSASSRFAQDLLMSPDELVQNIYGVRPKMLALEVYCLTDGLLYFYISY